MDSLKVPDTSFFQTKNSLGMTMKWLHPPKFNIELENKSLEKESPFGIFSGSMLNFEGYTFNKRCFNHLEIRRHILRRNPSKYHQAVPKLYPLVTWQICMYMCTYNGINIWLPIYVYVLYEFIRCIRILYICLSYNESTFSFWHFLLSACLKIPFSKKTQSSNSAIEGSKGPNCASKNSVKSWVSCHPHRLAWMRWGDSKTSKVVGILRDFLWFPRIP